jgi:hypothetical protein
MWDLQKLPCPLVPISSPVKDPCLEFLFFKRDLVEYQPKAGPFVLLAFVSIFFPFLLLQKKIIFFKSVLVSEISDESALSNLSPPMDTTKYMFN